MRNKFGFNGEESRLLKSLNTPQKIQRFVSELQQHPGLDYSTCFSPKVVMRERQADCVDGAIFAAATLRFHGERPLVMNLSAVNDDGHCVALFCEDKYIGAIAKSDGCPWLEFREPIYRNPRELASSYFEGYHNRRRQKTLRGYSGIIDLSRFDKDNWMTTLESVLPIAVYVANSPCKDLVSERIVRKFSKVSPKISGTGQI